MTYSQWHLFARNEAILFACLLQKKGLERLGSLLRYLVLLGVIRITIYNCKVMKSLLLLFKVNELVTLVCQVEV